MPRFDRLRDRTARSLQDRGPLASVAMLLEEVAGTVRYGRATAGTVPVEELDGDPEHHALETARFRTARRALAAVPAGCRTGGLVDLGCGRGRVLLMAVAAGFAPVTGVELAPVLAADARRATRGHPIEVVAGDAAGFDLPATTATVFLGNPFGPRTLAAVVDQVDAAQAARPRPIAVAYINPVHRAVLLDRGFAVVATDPDFVVLHRSTAP